MLASVCMVSSSPVSSPVGRIRPSREEFHEAARRGNLIPVYREMVADGDTR